MSELEIRPLLDPADAQAVDDARRDIQQDPAGYPTWSGSVVGSVAMLVVLGPLALLIVALFVVLALLAFTGETDIEPTVSSYVTLGVALVFCGGILAGLIVAIVSAFRARGPAQLARVRAFAHANGFGFIPVGRNKEYEGRLWSFGSPTFLLDHFTVATPEVQFDYGTVGASSKGRPNPLAQGYVAIRLPRHLPNYLLLHGRGWGIAGDGDPFSLEGDFSDTFSLWVPDGYERDALQFFTPDLMALLLDEARRCALEVVDDYLFVMLPGYDVMDARDHAWAHRLAHVVGAKAQKQSANYRDERVTRDPRRPRAVDRVADAGRRLPAVIWVPGIILAVAIATSPFWGVFLGWVTGEGR